MLVFFFAVKFVFNLWGLGGGAVCVDNLLNC